MVSVRHKGSHIPYLREKRNIYKSFGYYLYIVGKMRNILIKDVDEDKYWKWKDVKNDLRAEDWESMVDKLIEFYEREKEND